MPGSLQTDRKVWPALERFLMTPAMGRPSLAFIGRGRNDRHAQARSIYVCRLYLPGGPSPLLREFADRHRDLTGRDNV